MQTTLGIFHKNYLKFVKIHPDSVMIVTRLTIYHFRNRIAFKIFNKTKPGKYGINYRTLNSSQVAYCYQVNPYAGKPVDVTDPPNCGEQNCAEVTQLFYQPKTLEVVKDLLRPIGWERLKGCHLTTDNYYTSLELLRYLHTKNLTFCGTARSNRKGVNHARIKGRFLSFHFDCH